MTASAERTVGTNLHRALDGRWKLVDAQKHEREATIEYMDAALAAGWSWPRIGDGIGVTATGARRYYERNRTKVRSV